MQPKICDCAYTASAPIAHAPVIKYKLLFHTLAHLVAHSSPAGLQRRKKVLLLVHASYLLHQMFWIPHLWSCSSEAVAHYVFSLELFLVSEPQKQQTQELVLLSWSCKFRYLCACICFLIFMAVAWTPDRCGPSIVVWTEPRVRLVQVHSCLWNAGSMSGLLLHLRQNADCIRIRLGPYISQFRYLIRLRVFLKPDKMKCYASLFKLFYGDCASWFGWIWLNWRPWPWCETAWCLPTDRTSDLSCICWSVCLRVCGCNAAPEIPNCYSYS